MGKLELVLVEWSSLQSMHLLFFLLGEILISAIQGFNSHFLQPSGIREMSCPSVVKMLLAGQNFKARRRDIFRIRVRVELADNEK